MSWKLLQGWNTMLFTWEMPPEGLMWCCVLICNRMEGFKLTCTKCLAGWTLPVVGFSFVNPGCRRESWMGKGSSSRAANSEAEPTWRNEIRESLSKRYEWIKWVFLPGLHCSPQNTGGTRSDTQSQDRELGKRRWQFGTGWVAFGLVRSRWLEIHRARVISFRVHMEWSVKLMAHSHKIITNTSAAGLHLWVCTGVESWQIKELRDLLSGPSGLSQSLEKAPWVLCQSCKYKGHGGSDGDSRSQKKLRIRLGGEAPGGLQAKVQLWGIDLKGSTSSLRLQIPTLCRSRCVIPCQSLTASYGFRSFQSAVTELSTINLFHSPMWAHPGTEAALWFSNQQFPYEIFLHGTFRISPYTFSMSGNFCFNIPSPFLLIMWYIITKLVYLWNLSYLQLFLRLFFPFSAFFTLVFTANQHCYFC